MSSCVTVMAMGCGGVLGGSAAAALWLFFISSLVLRPSI
jgi:hypothetical protein